MVRGYTLERPFIDQNILGVHQTVAVVGIALQFNMTSGTYK